MITAELYQLTAEVAEFLEEISGEMSRESFQALPEMSYADALLNWRRDHKNEMSFFSTDSPLLLKYQAELEKQFGLPVLTHEEGTARERKLRAEMSVRRLTTKHFIN